MASGEKENEHLLENQWVLWFRPPNVQAKDWETSQQRKFDADTVESFWRGFQKLPSISPGHAVNCDYSLFKYGIKPMWEDEFNEGGGRWSYTVERRQSNLNSLSSTNTIAQAWLDVMLCLIGEGFDPYGHMVGGGVCGIRGGRGPNKGSEMNAKICIWTKDASNAEANIKIGEVLKEVLHAPDGSLIYQAHETAAGGARKAAYSYKL